MIPRWAQDVKMDDLTASAREIAEVIGMDAALKLMSTYGGTNTYVPKIDEQLRNVRNRHIRDEYNGRNAQKLAYRYGLSDRMIQKIAEGRSDQIDGQITLFDCTE